MFIFEFSWKIVSRSHRKQAHSIVGRSWHSLLIRCRCLTTPLCFTSLIGKIEMVSVHITNQASTAQAEFRKALSGERKGATGGGRIHPLMHSGGVAQIPNQICITLVPVPPFANFDKCHQQCVEQSGCLGGVSPSPDGVSLFSWRRTIFSPLLNISKWYKYCVSP